MTEAIITHYTVGKKTVSYVMNILYQGKQWTVQRRFSDFVKLDKKLRAEGYNVGYDLPNKVVFGNFYRNVLDHRRKELNKYLTTLCGSISSDNTYLREFYEVDENMLKNALKQSRRMSDIYRSDHAQQICKRASQLMINGSNLRPRRFQHQHRKEYNKPPISQQSSQQSSSSLPGRTRSIGSMISSSSNGDSFSGPSQSSSAHTNHSHRKQKPLNPHQRSSKYASQGKSGSNNSTSHFHAGLKETTRQRDSFSSYTDSLVDSWQDSLLITTLKDNFMAHSSQAQSLLSDRSSDRAQQLDIGDAIVDTEYEDDIQSVNSCFRQKSDDGTWKETSSSKKIIDILAAPSPKNMTKNIATMSDIGGLITQQLTISLNPDDVVVDPSSMWEEASRNTALTTSPRPPKPPYRRPHSQESTIPLRLRFSPADAQTNISPHLVKHLL